MEPTEPNASNTAQHTSRRRGPQHHRPGQNHHGRVRRDMPTLSSSGSGEFQTQYHHHDGEQVNAYNGQQQQQQVNNYNNYNNGHHSRRPRYWPRSQQQNRPYNNNSQQNCYQHQQYQQNDLVSSFGAQLNFNEHQQSNGFAEPVDHPQQNYRQGKPNNYNNYRNNRRNNYQRKQQPQDSTNKNEFQHEIMDDLLRQADYECIICCEVIQLQDKTWNCDNCFNVLHLKCVRSWATKCSNDKAEGSGSSNNNGNDGGQGTSSYNNSRRNNQPEEWRCPTCQDVKKQIPFAYYCFCGKRKNPEVSNYHVPHSCGDVCGRELKSFNKPTDDDQAFSSSPCPHSCMLKCHPGKCPTCQLKVMESCACGHTRVYVSCAVGVSEIKCPKPCGKRLDCGNHTCERNCHFGPCDRCTIVSDAPCKCGKLVRANVACKDQSIEFGCDETCLKMLSCGFHKCTRPCHSGDCGRCPSDPAAVQHCPCGKTLLASMVNVKKRELCTDPIPNCFKICGKLQPCSTEKEPHPCKSICHTGPCPPCLLSTIMRCNCGANTQKFDCKDLDGRKGWSCQKRCNKKLSCGRHKCLNLCCTDKQHNCQNLCRRKLSCGQHLCDEPCHPNCGPCPNLIWEEVACNCGDKVLYPPLACTTKKPLCDLPCSREHGCQHEPKHQCTSEYNQQQQPSEQEQCPPCTEFVSKMCFGGHEMRHSTPCYQTRVSCGRFCMKQLAGCGHGCQKVCHDGACPACTSKCDRPRVDCTHQGCGLTCHSDDVQCSKSRCREKLMVFCKCENKTEVKECYEVNNSRVKACLRDKLVNKFSFNTDVHLDEIEQMVEYNTLHPLECDDQCAREKRSKELAEAFGCERTKLVTTKYSNFLKAEAKKNPQFVKNLQDKFAALIISFYKNDQKQASHSFPPMNKINREVIHHLSDYYGLTSQSFDREPNRNVIVTASKTSKLPEVTLLDSVNIDGGSTSKAFTVVKAMTSSSEQQQQNKKMIDYFNFDGGED